MSNLIITYPRIGVEDYEYIQSIREKQDSRYYSVVRPHLTLVFGTDKLSTEQLKDHACTKLGGFRKVQILLDSAIVVEDDSKTFFHTFLVPSTGYDEIVKCHDALYTGELATELRHDIPFIPHVGIGTSSDKAEMEKLAQDLNDKGVKIAGSVDELSIVTFDGSAVLDIGKMELL